MSQLETWRAYSPARDWGRLQKVVNHLIDDVAYPYTGSDRDRSLDFAPPCEISENKNQYMIKFDVPGIPKDKIKIELHENQLTVSGERETRKNTEGERSHLSEFSYGSFMRSFTLPNAVDGERVQAHYDAGVLSITLEKVEGAKARQITIR